MLVHIRRSVTLAAVALVLTFAYAFLGTGVSQLLFKHQADGSHHGRRVEPDRAKLVPGAVPGSSLGSCVFQGRPDAVGPYAGSAEAGRRRRGQPAPGQQHPRQARRPELRRVRRDQPRAPLQDPLENTQTLVAYWKARGVNPTPDLVTTSAAATTPTSASRTPWCRSRWCRRPPGSRLRCSGAWSSARRRAPSSASWAPRTSDVLQLNEALAKLEK